MNEQVLSPTQRLQCTFTIPCTAQLWLRCSCFYLFYSKMLLKGQHINCPALNQVLPKCSLTIKDGSHFKSRLYTGGSVLKNPGYCWLSIAAFCNWALQKGANKLCCLKKKLEPKWKHNPWWIFRQCDPAHISRLSKRGAPSFGKMEGRSSLQKGGMLSAREEARESRSWGNVRWIKWKASGRAQAHSSFLVSQTAVSCLQLTCSESFQNKTWVLGIEHCAPKTMEDRYLSVPVPSMTPRTVTDNSTSQGCTSRIRAKDTSSYSIFLQHGYSPEPAMAWVPYKAPTGYLLP